MLKKIGVICLAFVLGLALLPSITLAQSTGLELRLSRLESENFQLRSQINQIQSQVSRLSQSQPQRGLTIPPAPAPVPSITPRRQRHPTETNQIVDRLATLAIELKERVNRLEAQVAELKKQAL